MSRQAVAAVANVGVDRREDGGREGGRRAGGDDNEDGKEGALALIPSCLRLKVDD